MIRNRYSFPLVLLVLPAIVLGARLFAPPEQLDNYCRGCEIQAIKFSPGDSHLFVASSYSPQLKIGKVRPLAELRAWDTTEKTLFRSLYKKTQFQEPSMSLGVSSDESQMIATGFSEQLDRQRKLVFDLQTLTEISNELLSRDFRFPKPKVPPSTYSAEFEEDRTGEYGLIATVKTPKKTVQLHLPNIQQELEMDNSTHLVAVREVSGKVHIWNPDENCIVGTFVCMKPAVSEIPIQQEQTTVFIWLPKQQLLCVSTEGGRFIMWSSRQRQIVCDIMLRDTITLCALSHNGKSIAFARTSGRIDLLTVQELMQAAYRGSAGSLLN